MGLHQPCDKLACHTSQPVIPPRSNQTLEKEVKLIRVAFKPGSAHGYPTIIALTLKSAGWMCDTWFKALHPFGEAADLHWDDLSNAQLTQPRNDRFHRLPTGMQREVFWFRI